MNFCERWIREIWKTLWGKILIVLIAIPLVIGLVIGAVALGVTVNRLPRSRDFGVRPSLLTQRVCCDHDLSTRDFFFPDPCNQTRDCVS